MKMLRSIFLVGLIAAFFGCGASQKIKEPNAQLDQMMVEKAFKIKVKSVTPQFTQSMAQLANSGILAPGNTISNIDVTGAGYFIKVHGDSVSAQLPYYGERQMGGGYNVQDSGIQFNGTPKTIEIVQDELKKSYQVKFTVRDRVETYLVNAEVSTNNSSTVFIQSSHRNRIRYSGDVKSTE